MTCWTKGQCIFLPNVFKFTGRTLPLPQKCWSILLHILLFKTADAQPTNVPSATASLRPNRPSQLPPPKKKPRKIPLPSFPSISEKISRRPNLDHHPILPPPCRKFSYTIFLALVSILNLFSRFLSFFPRPFCSSSFIEDYNRLVFTERRRDPKEMVQRPRQDFVYYFCFIFVERVARSHTFFFHLLFIGIFSGTLYVR